MTVMIKKHAKANFGTAVFYTFLLLLFTVTNAIFGTTGYIKNLFTGISEAVTSTVERPVQTENKSVFDVSKGGDRFFVLTHMNSVADQRCTLKVMKENRLNQPGSPCQSYGDYLIYTEFDGDQQIILGFVKDRLIETKVVIVPNEWRNGEWRIAAVPGFDWSEAARILAAGNSH